MATKAAPKAVKKVTKVKAPVVTMPVKQAQMLQKFATKNSKSFKFLDAKITAVNA